MVNRFELFTFLIAGISKSIHRIKSEIMEREGLKSSHVPVLYYLAVKGRLTVTELTHLSLDDKANLSRTAAELDGMGLIKREARGRRTILSLTEEGRIVGERMRGYVAKVLSVSSAGLTEEEREAMYSALSVINKNLNSYESKT